MPGEKQPQSIWWNPTNSWKERTKCSRKKSQPTRGQWPKWWTTCSTASLGKTFQQSILRSPVATQLICLDLRHSPQIWKPRLLLFRGFSIRPISIFQNRTRVNQALVQVYNIWYTYTLSIHLLCVWIYSVHIYIYVHMTSTHSRFSVFSHVSWKTVLVKEDMVRQCRVRKITYP